ncbi:hypothetical protein [Methanospirillum stamsii]|nr:hypothetical protein [Methanospirillum stamsii]
MRLLQQVHAVYQQNVAALNLADIITRLLGGATTGIIPYRINQVTS